MKKIYLITYLLALALFGYAQDTLIYNNTVTINSDLSDYENVEVVGIEGITFAAGFEYSSNGNGELTTDGDPMGVEAPEGFAPFVDTETDSSCVSTSSGIDYSLVPGSIRGSASVGGSGAATYNIPIELPKGNMGIVPQLSINYSSQSGKGILGRGWSLGGISTISAMGKNKYYDGKVTAISSTDSENRLYWDGQRLIAHNGDGFEADSFVTEIASNVKIYKREDSQNDYWFEILTPEGKTMEYGNSPSSSMNLNSSTEWKWLLNRVYDRNGNEMTYTYQINTATHENLLSKIDYGGSDGKLNKITLHYGTNQVSYAYIHNNLVLNSVLLDSISITSNGQFYGGYGLSYMEVAGELLFDQIKQYDKDSYSYNPTKVSWESPVFDLTKNVSTKYIISGSDITHHYGDFTGDGYTDIMAVKMHNASRTYEYYLYRGSENGISSSYESGDLPRSFTHMFWDDLGVLYDAFCPNGNFASEYDNTDFISVISGDFDGDGIFELMVKTAEWDELANRLPGDLNDPISNPYFYLFGVFGSDICNYSFLLENPGFIVNYKGIGKLINFDMPETSDDWVTSFRLGTTNDIIYQKKYFPDLDGKGYSCFPDEGKIYYYESDIDSAIVYCNYTTDDKQWWGEFTGDGKADYIEVSDLNSKPVKAYSESTNSFSTVTTITDELLGLFDVNGDGISGWVLIGDEEFDELHVSDVWDDFCSMNQNCNYQDQMQWEMFIYSNGFDAEYLDFKQYQCGGNDTYTCRFNFIQTYVRYTSKGRPLYVKHYTGRGPEIHLEYLAGSTLGLKTISADIDSDGKNDLLLFSPTSLLKVYYDFKADYNGLITYTFESEICTKDLESDAIANDFNGDGILELLSPGSDKTICFISGKPGKQVSSIKNGLGVESRFHYDNLMNSGLYTKQSNAEFPVIDLIAPWYVVQSLSTDNGIATADSTVYKYEGAKLHLQGKGFLGFMNTSAANVLTNTISESVSDYNTTYYQTYPVSNMQKVGSTNIKKSESYQSFIPVSGHRYQYRTDSSIVTDYLNDTEITTSLTYYANGLAKSKRVTLDDQFGQNEYYEYCNAGWHVDYLPEKQVRQYIQGNNTLKDSSFFSYDNSGNLLLKKELWGSDQEQTKRFREFNSYGNPQVISSFAKKGLDLEEDSTTLSIEYSNCSRFVIAKKTPMNQNVYTLYNYSTGQLLSSSSINEKQITYTYGPFNIPQKKTDPDGLQTVTKTYWAENHSEAPTGAFLYKWSKSSGTPEVITFADAAGRELRTISVGFEDELIYSDKEYDSRGRISKKSMPYVKGNTPQWTTYSYDTLGRVTEENAPDGSKTSYYYDELWQKTTVSKGSVSQSSEKTFNAKGEIIQSKDNSGNIVYCSYYPDGKLKETYTSTYPTHKTSFEYDDQGNRTKIIDPDAGTITTLYDGMGKLLRQVDAKGDTTIFEYDQLGRTIKSSDARGDINYVFISDTASKAFGQIDSIYNAGGSMSESFTYDVTYGRTSSITKRIPNKSFTNSYTYDWYGRLLTRAYPSGFEIHYSYTDNGDLEEIYSDGQSIWTCDDVNELGQITDYSQGSYASTIDFDAYGRLEEITTGTVFNMEYSFDDIGNLLSRRDVRTSQKELFTYDDLNRLTDIEYYLSGVHQSSADFAIFYGDDGNIISKTDVAETINYGEDGAGPHALTSINAPVVGYDDYPQSIDYTCFNKVETIRDTVDQNTIASLAFTYGLNNQRVKTILQENSQVQRVKYFDEDYEEDSTATGIKKYHYIHSPSGLIGIFVREGSADTLFHVLSDHLGSLNGVINTESDEVSYYSFNAWGVARNANDWTLAFDGELFADRGFTGHEHLIEFSLINMNGRVYDPVLARFLSPDPYVQAPGYANSFNRYAYCWNNPLVYTDPEGESLVAFAIGFAISAYLTGVAYNKDWTPWSTGKNGDQSWAWDDPGMYVTMGVIGLAGGFGAAMGWGVLASNYSFNLTIGTGIGEAVQTGAQFLVSNSGIVFQGLGYTTAAGGGAFLTYEAIKGIKQANSSPIKPYYSNDILYTSEADALQTLEYLSQGEKSNELIMYALNDGGYYYEPFSGYSANHDGSYKYNSESNCWPYTYLSTDQTGTTYISPSFDRHYSVNYMVHPHPNNNPTSLNDSRFAKNRNINVFALGYDGNIHIAERGSGYRVDSGINFWDILFGLRSLQNYRSKLDY